MAAFQKRMLANWHGAAASGRALLRAALPCLLALSLGAAARAQETPVKGEVRVETAGGFARIVLRLSEEVESDVRQAGAIVVIGFKRPVEIATDRIAAQASGYVSAARRDPDGLGVRLALNRKVTVNAMAAGERLFVDLLPESWTGLPPGLPKEVIEELARRAREAEKALRAQQQSPKRTIKPVRVRVAVQPTFVRYVFELPDLIPVFSDRGEDDLTLTFSAPMKFDLTEARAYRPAAVRSLDANEAGEGVAVRFVFEGKTDIRSFREDNNYVVDVGVAEAEPKIVLPPAAAKPERPPQGVAAPQTVPALAPPAKPAEPARGRSERASEKQGGSEPGNAAASPAVVVEAPGVKGAADTGDTPPAKAQAPQTTAAGLTASLSHEGDNVRLVFPFLRPTPAAIFRRGATLWIVFDSKDKIDLAALNADAGNMIRSAEAAPSQDGQVVRVVLERPRLVSAVHEGATWAVTIGDSALEETQPLGIARNISTARKPSVTIPFEQPREAHKIRDPEIGDTMLVVTGFGPARGFLKPQDFVEFRALASTHGVALQPIAEDVLLELSADKIIVSRPQGLILSGAMPPAKNAAAYRPMVLDAQLWGFDRQSKFTERQYQLIAAAADAEEDRRTPPRLDLARFYLAREMFVESKAVLDVALSEDRAAADDGAALVLRAVSNIMLNRPDEALKDLGNPAVGDNHDAPLWRAFAHARQGKWSEARLGFKNVEAAIATLPIELQRLALKEVLRATIETRDFQTAAAQVGEFETVGLPADMRPAVDVLNGRLAQGLGRTEQALRHYRAAAESADRPAAAQAQLRELALRYDLGDLKRPDMIAQLETLTALWRGDETEIEALHRLGRLYTEENRYRDAFHVMRTALRAHPDSDMTRRIHDEAAVTFDSLFLAGKGDTLSAIDALSLFYDYRELTPIGRRGDEMIRRLADRLVSVDLLPQAAELLQHQIDHRLQGAARAQVATRLAVIYLMDGKPDRAQHAIRMTRMAGLSNELRHLRLLLEARAMSDIGRHDVALDVISNIDLREAARLRADILWAARRFGEAAEQIERLHGDSWKRFEPLTEPERADILRAAIGYALGDDMIGTARLRERYQGKMADGPSRHAFDVATSPAGISGSEFRDMAKFATAGTLEDFLREMRVRFPEIGAMSPASAPPRPQGDGQSKRPAADPDPTGSLFTTLQRVSSR